MGTRQTCQGCRYEGVCEGWVPDRHGRVAAVRVSVRGGHQTWHGRVAAMRLSVRDDYQTGMPGLQQSGCL